MSRPYPALVAECRRLMEQDTHHYAPPKLREITSPTTLEEIIDGKARKTHEAEAQAQAETEGLLIEDDA